MFITANKNIEDSKGVIFIAKGEMVALEGKMGEVLIIRNKTGVKATCLHTDFLPFKMEGSSVTLGTPGPDILASLKTSISNAEAVLNFPGAKDQVDLKLTPVQRDTIARVIYDDFVSLGIFSRL